MMDSDVGWRPAANGRSASIRPGGSLLSARAPSLRQARSDETVEFDRIHGRTRSLQPLLTLAQQIHDLPNLPHVVRNSGCHPGVTRSVR